MPVGVTFVTSLLAVGIMECFAFHALDGSFWHASLYTGSRRENDENKTNGGRR